MKKLLITGGTGLLGKALIETSSDEFELMGTYVGNYVMENAARIKYRKLDIRDKEGYIDLFKIFKPETTIHTAGIGSPEYADRNKKEAWEINVGGTQNIISLCEQFSSRIIYISSNGIYDGEKAPYGEEDEANPVNYYGEIKLKGEEITKNADVSSAIVRPILMYGWNYPFERYNIVAQGILKLGRGEQMFVYDDVFINPLFNHFCAKSIWKIIEHEKNGVYNIAGGERASIYKLIKTMAKIFNFDEDLIKPVQEGFFNEFVKRPKDTSFKTGKMEKELGMKPLSLAEGLTIMRDNLKK